MARSVFGNLGRAFLLVGAAGLLMFAVKHRLRERDPLTCIAGSVQARARAIVPVSLATRYLDAQRIRFGIGDGAVGGWKDLGDAVVAGGLVWLRSTDTTSPDYYHLVTSRYFQTSYLAYVPAGTQPSATHVMPPGETVDQIWRQLASRYPQGVMVEGYAKMRMLATIAISRPPFSGLAIASDTPFYYTEPMESANDVWVYLIGITGQLTPARAWTRKRSLINLVPRAQMHNASGLADALLLRGSPQNTDLPPPADTVRNLGQVVGYSTVARGQMRIYPIRRISGCSSAWLR